MTSLLRLRLPLSMDCRNADTSTQGVLSSKATNIVAPGEGSADLLSPRRTSPMVLEDTTTEHLTPMRLPGAVAVPRSAAGFGKQIPRDGGPGHLEGGIKAVADHLHADLDEFLPQARQRSVLDRPGRSDRGKRSQRGRQCSQEIADVPGEGMQLKTDSVGGARGA
jgi:hypothetical protein